MDMSTHLSASDLIMYLGCEVEWLGERGYFLAGINTWQDNFNPVGLVSEQMGPVWVLADQIKPILRPLSDMTDDEKKEFVLLCAGSQVSRFQESVGYYQNGHTWQVEFDNGDTDFLVMNDNGETWFSSYFQRGEVRRNWSNTVKQHNQTIWLLARHFDLFGWIDACLAIDKTKTVTP